MNTLMRFHTIHGEHVRLSRNHTTAERVDSFCKGICFSNRTIQIQEKVYLRLRNKALQWTGFLRLGVTTCDPKTHRGPLSLPRHACPDLTCRPGYWAKCVPENCFDFPNKLTYFYVDENGELFLNTPNGEILFLTGITMNEPLWVLFDIYGNCLSIELVNNNQENSNRTDPQPPNASLTTAATFYQELRHDLTPLIFLPVHSSSISFSSPTPTESVNHSVVIYDNRGNRDGLVYFATPLKLNSGLLIQILNINPKSESRNQSATASPSLSTHIQFGVTNCDTKQLSSTNSLPLDMEQINNRPELWIVHDFKLAAKSRIDRQDEFLFIFTKDGIIEYSHNNSKLQDFIHVDPTLIYYPFLVFKGDILAVRSVGFLKSLERIKLSRRTNNDDSKTDTKHSSPKLQTNESRTGLNSQRKDDCSICFDELRDTVFIPCGHVCVCYKCATELNQIGSKQCPICRTTIQHINKIYMA